MKRLLLLLALAALVAVALGVTKEEQIAKKVAFKKGKGGTPQKYNEHMHKLKEQQQKHAKVPGSKKATQEDKKAIAHKRKISEDRAQAKMELQQAQGEFRQAMAAMRGDDTMSTREKQRQIITMKQDFMANISNLKERMGLDPSKTDRMAWKQAQLKKQKPIKLNN